MLTGQDIIYPISSGWEEKMSSFVKNIFIARNVINGWKLALLSAISLDILNSLKMRTLIFGEERVDTPKRMDFINNRLQKFILINGLSFVKIEDKYLHEVCPTLPSRKQHSKNASDLALKIEDYIIKELKNYNECCISLDEWTDQLRRRYLGITVQAVSHEKIVNFVLSLAYINFESVTGDNLRSLIISKLEKYNILNKIKVCITDSGSNMISACDGLPFMRLPCFCHVMNILLSSFIKSTFDIFNPIFNLQREQNSSKFVTFLINKKNKRLAIPNYCSVRWYSVCDLLEALADMKESIIEFRTLEKMKPVPPSMWTTIIELVSFFRIFKQIMEMIESDDFGTISYVLRGITVIENSINLLSEQFSEGKNSFNEKLGSYWTRYNKYWDPLLYADTRLNPSLSASQVMTPEEIIRGDNLIKELMQQVIEKDNKVNPIPPLIKKNHPLMCFQETNENQEITIIFEEYKANQVPGLVNLYDYWKNNSSGRFKVLSKVAFQILSLMCTSSSAERLFSKSKRISFHRMGLGTEKMEDISLMVGNKEIAESLIK